MTPFQALYGYESPRWKDFALLDSRVPVVKDHLGETQRIINLLKENLTMARNRMKQQADQHRSKREFEEGDWVFVRLQPYKQLSLKQEGKNKLSHKYYGPYQIIKKISSVAYGLRLRDNCQIHNTFHVSSLKRVLGKNQIAQTEIPKTDEEGRIFLEPEGITCYPRKGFTIQDNTGMPDQMEEVTRGRLVLGIRTFPSSTPKPTYALTSKHLKGKAML